MLTNRITLEISGFDNLRPLDIYFRPSHIVYMTMNIINDVVQDQRSFKFEWPIGQEQFWTQGVYIGIWVQGVNNEVALMSHHVHAKSQGFIKKEKKRKENLLVWETNQGTQVKQVDLNPQPRV